MKTAMRRFVTGGVDRVVPSGRGLAAIACGVALLALPSARASGPNNQFVPNPAPVNANTYSSVVGVVGLNGAGKINNTGTGTIIDSYINPDNDVAYFCVLTADHVVKAGVKDIVFPNYVFGSAPPATGTYQVISSMQVAGLNAMQNVDASVLLVRYGAADAFFFNTPDKALATSVGVGNKVAEVGFGDTATPNFVAGKLTSLTEVSSNFQDKRYQNNVLTAFIANNVHGVYTENDVTYTFDAQGQPNFVSGEGFGFVGDSGAPLFNNGTTFDPGGGLPLIAGTDSIAGMDVFGPGGTINNGAVETTVDIFDYRANIQAACAAQLRSVPEPSTAILLAIGAGFGWVARRTRHLGERTRAA